jgi:superfamily II DNA or RNA helicase
MSQTERQQDATADTESTITNGAGHQHTKADKPRWPPHKRFPYNRSRKDGERRVADTVVAEDLQHAAKVLIITGFTSLPRIISFLAQREHNVTAAEPIRILIGHEPNLVKPKSVRIGGDAIAEEIRDYWLREKLSIYQSHDLVCAKEMLKDGRVVAKTSRDKHRLVHAKIFKADDTITFGSSNFSESGLKQQVEMNLRLLQSEEKYADLFIGVGQYAEQIWVISQDYTTGLYELLKQLCHEATWQEALARGCAELLEGRWAKRYLEYAGFGETPQLWPFQEQGVLESLFIVETVGNVLIADATGSGKTWIGSALIKSILRRIWSNPARLRNDIPVLLVPPKVMDDWQNVAHAFGISPSVFSHGAMSLPQSGNHKKLIRLVPRAQILAVDEAHNFLNRQSRRSQMLIRNMADHVILFTATPVNREPSDLFRIVTLLGPDNFDDEVLNVLERMVGGRKRRKNGGSRYFTEEERTILQNAVQQFTLRRTKHVLSQMIEAQPEKYQRGDGARCRYPDHKTFTYACEASIEDKLIAQEIYATAQQLKGLLWLTTLKRSAYMPITDQQFLVQRLKGAQGLALHQVMDCLRSSRVALLEHICGTDVALKEGRGFDQQIKLQQTGAVIKKLVKMTSKLPKIDLNEVALPEWLVQPAAYAAACKEEATLYARIGELATRLSSAREEAKAQKLVSLLQRHNAILAFDRHLITLHDLQHRISALNPVEIIVATGENEARVRQIQKRLHPDTLSDSASEEHKLIVLCSDVLSEGVNLQKASAVVNLDMPTVIRRVEQRIGRVDRIDSPHDFIESWWPKDSPEFLPRAHERLFERHLFVHDVLGSNIVLPSGLYENELSSDDIITSEQVIREWRQEQKKAETQDPFAAIRDLVIGQHAIIPKKVYQDISAQTAQIHTAVSIVQSANPWAFLVIQGTNGSAPRFVYMDDVNSTIVTKLDEVAAALRRQLHADIRPRHLDKVEMDCLRSFVDRLAQSEHLLLPKRKQHALEEMRIILKTYLKLEQTAQTASNSNGQTAHTDAAPSTNGQNADTSEREGIIRILIKCADGSFRRADGETSVVADVNVLAELWLDVIRPVWYAYLSGPQQKRKLVRLRDIRSLLQAEPLKTEALRQIIETEVLWISPVDERMAAVIVGVPDAS